MTEAMIDEAFSQYLPLLTDDEKKVILEMMQSMVGSREGSEPMTE